MQQPPHALVLIKEQLLTGHDSHYAGGIHLFSQLCRQLSDCSAFDVVHTLSTATKALVLHHAVTHQLLHQIQTQTTSCGTEVISWKQDDSIHHHVIVRQPSTAADPAAPGGLNSLGGSSTARAAAAAVLSALGDILQELTAQGRAGSIILDTDTLQHASVPALWPPGSLPTAHHAGGADGSGTSNSHDTQAINPLPDNTNHTGCSTPQQAPRQLQQDAEQERGTDVPFTLALSLQLQACLQAQLSEQPQHLITHPHAHMQLPSAQEPSNGSVRQLRPTWTLLALVQNIHHLPFGPCGTAPMSAGVLQGWRAVAGVICVSDFVRSYLSQHAVPLLPQLQPSQLHVTHPAAFGVWGPGPFADLGTAAAARLWGSVEHPAAHAAADCHSPSSCTEGTGAAPAGVGQGDSFCGLPDARKAEPGSGSAGDILNPVAGSLHQQQYQWQQQPVVGMLKLTREKGSALFLALAWQLPALQFLAVCADPSVQQEVSQSADLGNVKLLGPVEDVSSILQQMSLVLVPSVLQEAFGMVVQDAMLHGVPVIVAAAGALPEAAAGAAAAVLPVRLVEFPPAARSATSDPPLQAAARGSGENTQQLAQPAQAACLSPCCCHKATCDCCWLMDQRKWDSRVYPDLQQHEIDTWATAIQQVLSSRECFQRASKLSRTAALQAVQQGKQHLDALVQQLLQTGLKG